MRPLSVKTLSSVVVEGLRGGCLGGEVGASVEAHDLPADVAEYAVGYGREGGSLVAQAVVGVEVEGVEKLIELVVAAVAEHLPLGEGQTRRDVAEEVDEPGHPESSALRVHHAVVDEVEVVGEELEETDVVGGARGTPLESDDVFKVDEALHKRPGDLVLGSGSDPEVVVVHESNVGVVVDVLRVEVHVLFGRAGVVRET